jgi:Uma2 family endonuclease
MTADRAGQIMTAQELAALPDDGNRYELVRGRLVCMSPSFIPPSFVSGNVFLELGGFVKRHQLGACGTAAGGFRLFANPDTVRAPDVWFVRRERIPAGGFPQEFWPGPPDPGVEVLSPSDRFAAVIAKVREYLDAGTRLVWVIDPRSRVAGIFWADGSAALIGEAGVLDGADLGLYHPASLTPA